MLKISIAKLLTFGSQIWIAAILLLPQLSVAEVQLPVAVDQASSLLDALNRPSINTLHSQTSLMTSIVRAGTRLVACGERGVILISDNEGQTWRQAQSVPVSVTLTRLFFLDAKLGWAVGHSGIVLSSTDGGEHWVKQLDGKQAAALEINAARAEGGSPQRLANADRFEHDGPDKPFFGIYFLDAKNGFVTGAYGLAFATDDGGQTWQSIIGRIDNSKGLHLYFINQDGNDIYISGEQGVLYRSTDRGKQFKVVNSPSRGTYFGIVFPKPGQLIAFGLRGSAFKSIDAGIHWDKIELPAITVTAGLRLSDGSVVLSNEYGQLIRSHDDGATFQPIPQTQTTSVVSLVEASDGHLILAGARNLTRLAQPVTNMEAKK
jgi:photosystem II stability/assembly factor-like uncharacterized protein